VLHGIDRNRAEVSVGNYIVRETESPLHVTLAQGVSRGERMDYTIQKAVELGVTRIVPLISERCEVRLEGERLTKRVQHWQAVAASACEQCGRNRVPPVLAPVPLNSWLAEPVHGLRLVLNPLAPATLTSLSTPDDRLITLLIGPEGGLSDAEVKRAQQSGFVGIRLGPRILRTETAAVTALSALQMLWGDLG
jgi:16S rRNA (uracil1498-N3)-methyltransferase